MATPSLISSRTFFVAEGGLASEAKLRRPAGMEAKKDGWEGLLETGTASGRAQREDGSTEMNL